MIFQCHWELVKILHRKQFFDNPNPSFATDNKLLSLNYGKQLNHFFNKNNHGTNTTLVEGDGILNEDGKIAEGLNFFSKNTVSKLNI